MSIWKKTGVANRGLLWRVERKSFLSHFSEGEEELSYFHQIEETIRCLFYKWTPEMWILVGSLLGKCGKAGRRKWKMEKDTHYWCMIMQATMGKLRKLWERMNTLRSSHTWGAKRTWEHLYINLLVTERAKYGWWVKSGDSQGYVPLQNKAQTMTHSAPLDAIVALDGT